MNIVSCALYEPCWISLPHLNTESSPVLDTFCLAELIYYLINRQFLYRKFSKSVKIQ